MAELELSPRLQALGERVPLGARLADVGTDHAYLPVWLLLQGRIAGAVATDINEGPLRRGRDTARTYGVSEEQLSFLRRDGLTGVGPDQADTVVIAGMGGELIAHILEQAPWTKRALVLLQPMSAQPALRQWLLGHGYEIREETVIREGEKYYPILTVRGGTDRPYSLGELWAGRQRPGENNPHRLTYLEDLLRRRTRALAGMRQSTGLPVETIQRAEALVQQLSQLREEWIRWQP